MPPVRLNRRRFLGCSAAAGLALAQGKVGEAAGAGDPVGLGLIGLGNRGTALLRAALELPGARVVAVADADEKHRRRAQGIAEKAQGTRPEGFDRAGPMLERSDVDAVIVALPCDLHARVYCEAIRAGKTRSRLERRGIAFETDTYVVDEHLIWGATARILENLLERIEADDAGELATLRSSDRHPGA